MVQIYLESFFLSLSSKMNYEWIKIIVTLMSLRFGIHKAFQWRLFCVFCVLLCFFCQNHYQRFFFWYLWIGEIPRSKPQWSYYLNQPAANCKALNIKIEKLFCWVRTVSYNVCGFLLYCLLCKSIFDDYLFDYFFKREHLL